MSQSHRKAIDVQDGTPQEDKCYVIHKLDRSPVYSVISVRPRPTGSTRSTLHPHHVDLDVLARVAVVNGRVGIGLENNKSSERTGLGVADEEIVLVAVYTEDQAGPAVGL